MKILRIRLKNFNSLRGEQIIDFTQEPLAETGIFAITGPTGAGKSSILDVITLALFNRMPRISSSVKGISKSIITATHAIITRGEKDSFAEVEYEVENRQYRSRWSIATTRNNTLQDYRMELSEIKPDNPEGEIFDLKKSEVPEKNEQIIGLNYEQFVKSILLSQGEFARFLKSSANERGELLERITGTEIYREIGKAVFIRNKVEEEKLQLLKAQLDGIEILSSEQERALNEELSTFGKKQADFKRNLDFLRAQAVVIEEINLHNKKIKALDSEKINLDARAEILKTDFDKLEQHHKLLPLQDKFNEEETLEQKYKNLESTKIKLEKNISEKQVQQKQVEQVLNKQQVLLEEATKKYEKEQPKIADIRELDKEIHSVQVQFQEKSKEYKKDRAEITRLSQKKEDLHRQIQHLSKEKEHIQIWFSKNTGLDKLQEKLPLIQENFSNFDKSLKLLEKANKQNSKLLEFPVLNWYKAKDKLENEVKILNNSCTELASKLQNDKDIEELANQRTALLERHKELEYLKSIISEEQALDRELSKIKDQGTEIAKQIAEIEAEKQRISNELQIQIKKQEELEIRKERQNLEAKFENHRKELKENEACPLCGSTHHPYIKNYKNEVSETTKLLAAQKVKCSNIEKQLNETINLLGKRQTERTLKAEQYKETLKKQNTLKLNLSQNIKNLKFDKIPTIGVIDALLTEIVEQGKSIKQQMSLLSNLIKLKSQFTDIKLFRDDFLRSFTLFEHLNTLLDEFLDTSYDKLKMQAKIKKLAVLDSDYQKNILQKDNLTKEITLNGKELELGTDSLENKKDLLAHKETDLTNLKNVINKLINKRLGIIQADDINKYESELLKNKDKEEQKLNSLKNKLVVINTQISESKKQLEQIVEQAAQTSVVLQNLHTELTQIVRNLAYEDISSAKKNLMNYEQAMKIQQSLQVFEKQRAVWKDNFRTEKYKLAEQKKKLKTEVSKLEISEEIKQTESGFEQISQRIGAITQELKDNEIKKESTKDLKDKYKKQAKESAIWQQLKELIGDSEGKKYSEFAQEYTLRHLVSMANQHLEHFSDRYSILPNAELKKDLMISDSYQGDTVRSVSTLSGGETFLVSLAMALALADLAGAKTKIGSLFIDEGFGSLDQDTLDLAMDALEKLQVQSQRKIGIISHVESLKERIRTQIVVEKQAHGYSKLLIVNV